MLNTKIFIYLVEEALPLQPAASILILTPTAMVTVSSTAGELGNCERPQVAIEIPIQSSQQISLGCGLV